MESTGSTLFLLFFAVLVSLPGTCSMYVNLPPLLHGTKGKPLLLPVDYNFSMEDVNFQGSWLFLSKSGGASFLLTFTKQHTIFSMGLERSRRILCHPPNASLLIAQLDESMEGGYQLKIELNSTSESALVTETKRVDVVVHVPVSIPVAEVSPASALVEDQNNVTWTCTVESGSRVQYQWLRDNVRVDADGRHAFSSNRDTLVISPVRKDDIGEYSCLVWNHVSREQSLPIPLSVYYGPYNLAVSSVQGLRTGAVFTIEPGERVFFDCWADSNPPNSCVWISKTSNSTKVLTTGPRLEVMYNTLAHPEAYVCRAFNNFTMRQDETQFTLVVASRSHGKLKDYQAGISMSPLAAITVSSFVIITCMSVVIFRKTCRPHRVLMSIYTRPLTEQKRTHLSGHEDATEDFGIYEFVAIPGKAESTQASNRSLAGLNSVQDLHTTIYDVIRHIPETPTQGLLK